MKVLKGLACLIFCLSFPVEAEELWVKGEVMRSVGFSPVGARSFIEWKVEIEVINEGRTPVRFDTVAAIWSAKDDIGSPIGGLQSTTYCSQAPGYWELRKGESTKFIYSTNGYTRNILSEAEERQIYFWIGFFYQDRIVGRIFTAPLPDLDKLPDYEEVMLARKEGKKAHGAPLRF